MILCGNHSNQFVDGMVLNKIRLLHFKKEILNKDAC